MVWLLMLPVEHHHAGTNWGEGFCLLNDQAMAANYLLNKGLAKSVLIIDLDVHQGNGTAQIFENNPAVFTFSMHGANNFPIQEGKYLILISRLMTVWATMNI